MKYDSKAYLFGKCKEELGHYILHEYQDDINDLLDQFCDEKYKSMGGNTV